MRDTSFRQHGLGAACRKGWRQHSGREQPPSSGLILFRFFVGVGAALSASVFAAPVALNPGTYELTVETLLPNLEENLRYATTRQRHCLGTEEVATLFPILRHEAFVGCDLTGGQSVGDRLEYALECSNREAATGAARLSVSPAGVSGVLEIKMGGKNMTLSQRISGPRLGACGPAQ